MKKTRKEEKNGSVMIMPSTHPPGPLCLKHTTPPPPPPPTTSQHNNTTPFSLPYFPLKFSQKPNMLDPDHTTSPHHEHPFLFNSSGLAQQRSDTYASRAQKTAQNYRSWNSMGARITNDDDDKYASGVCSPPLWKTTSPPRTPQRPINNYRNLSPVSRTRAIARGQREMMEMVRNMPESCYELSLKDLVEKQPMTIGIEVEDQEEEEEDASTETFVKGKDGLKKKKNERKPFVLRSTSMDSGGFLLKMVLPISFGSKKKMNYKKKSENCVVGNSITSTAKVSPKPQVFDGSHVKGGVVENEWWRKRVSGSGKSESGVSSLNSGSMKSSGSSSTSSCSSRSNSRRKSGSCWSFILLKKKKRQD